MLIRVLHTVSGLHVAGIGRLLLRNISALESERIRNHVAYLTPNHLLEPQFREAGISPICLGHSRTADGPRTLYRLMRLIRELDVDVVHTNHALDRFYGGLAARMTGVPSMTTAHDTFGAPHSRAERARAWVERHLLPHYIAVSAAVARQYEEHRGVSARRIRVIYSGIDNRGHATSPASETVRHLAEELGLRDAYPVLLNVARLFSIKGQEYLIAMMPQVLQRWPRATLLLAGDGPDRARLERAAAAMGVQSAVRLLGLRDDVHDLLALSTLFLFPSLSEGLPMAVLEAMAEGKAVIASRIGPMPEMIEDGSSGLLVPPQDPAALARAVDQLLGPPDLSVRMGRRAREIVAERFSIGATARAMEDAYRSVLRRHA